jgi:hypothetical protein
VAAAEPFGMRIVHAIAVVVGCALGLAIYRGLTPPLNAEFRAFGRFYDVVMGCAFGLILAGSVILAHRRWRGDAVGIAQPGHWLLAFGLVAAMASGAAIATYYGWYHVARSPQTVMPPHWIQFDLAWTPTYPGVFHQAVGWGLAGLAALGFCVASFRRLRLEWWVLFFVAALGSVSLFAGYATVSSDLLARPAAISLCAHSAHLYAKLVAVCLLMLVLATTRDVWQGQRRDGLHWTGVSVWIVILTMQLALYFRFMFGRMPFSESVWKLFTP